MVVLDGSNHKVISKEAYDTHRSGPDDRELGGRLFDQALQSLQRGSIIAIALEDAGTDNLSQYAKDFLTQMGSKEIQNLEFRQPWVFVGIVGKSNSYEAVNDNYSVANLEVSAWEI